jgi:hypothetical protein
MTVAQVRILAQSVRINSDVLDAWIMNEVVEEVLYRFRCAHDSFGYIYDMNEVQSVASESAVEVRRQIDSRNFQHDSQVRLLICEVSRDKTFELIHSR